MLVFVPLEATPVEVEVGLVAGSVVVEAETEQLDEEVDVLCLMANTNGTDGPVPFESVTTS